MSALQLSHRGKAAKLVDERGLPSHLKCSACSQPVFNSYQTSHGCRLCQSCVEALPIQEKVACPGRTEACRDKDEDTSINQTLCYPDKASRREISKLIVTCPNKEEGCGAQFPWRDVDTHLSSCDFEKVSCDMCGEKRVKKDMVEHKSSECRQRRVTCDCGAQVVALLMKEEHKNLMSATCCPNYDCKRSEIQFLATLLSRDSSLIVLPVCVDLPQECEGNTNGFLSWRITCIEQRRRESRIDWFASPIFKLNGYCFRAYIYLNGWGINKNSKVSVYLALVDGPDVPSMWPFRGWVTFRLINPSRGMDHLKKVRLNSKQLRPRPTDQFLIHTGIPDFLPVKKLSDFVCSDGCLELLIKIVEVNK